MIIFISSLVNHLVGGLQKGPVCVCIHNSSSLMIETNQIKTKHYIYIRSATGNVLNVDMQFYTVFVLISEMSVVKI